jgi:hypothetical protein
MEANQDMPQDHLTTADDSERPQPFRRFRASAGRSGGDAGYLESIQSELVLLREENARLRFQRAQPPGADSMIERLKALSVAQPPSEDTRDEAWHLISEALVMRDVLIDVCKEIGQTAVILQTRLSALTFDQPERMSDVRAQNARWLTPAAHDGSRG